MSSRRSRPLALTISAGTAVAGLVSGATVAAAAPASTLATVSGATLSWGLSNEQGGGAFFGGCNFLSAGTAGNTGSSRLWTRSDGFYRAAYRNVTIEKLTSDGGYERPTWNTKCQDANGAPVSAASTASRTGNRVVIADGTGTINRNTGTATLRWTGSFTSVFYGGLTYWTATNPVLTVSGGVGKLTASLSGYGADMDDPSRWVRIAPRSVTLATLHGITVGQRGFTVTPDYLDVAVDTPSGASAQTAKTTANAAYWGAFPQAFVDFQQLTGQSSYWFTSGGSRDAAKPATPLTLAWSIDRV